MTAEFATAVNFNPRTGSLSVDGKPFPWHVSMDGLQIDAVAGEMTVVWIPVMVDGPVTVEAWGSPP